FVLFCFFFQAEDGIRDDLVTGVQTCALPILLTRTRPKQSWLSSSANYPASRGGWAQTRSHPPFCLPRRLRAVPVGGLELQGLWPCIIQPLSGTGFSR